MNFPFFNLKNVTKLTNSHPSKRSIPSPDRRKFVKTMGFGVLAANPIIKTLGSLTETSFEIQHSKKYVAVLRDKKILWEISPNYFGNDTSIQVVKEASQITIDAKNLHIIQTQLQFDLTTVLYQENATWVMQFKIPQLGIDKTLPFIDWLDGYTDINSPVTLNTELVSLNATDNISLSGTFDCTITRNWEFTFKKHNAVKSIINKQTYYAHKLEITPNQEAFSDLVSQTVKSGARIIITENDNWNKLLTQLQFDKETAHLLTDDKLSVNISMGTTEADSIFKTLWISKAQGSLRLKELHTTQNQLTFSNYFYLSDYSQQETPSFFLSAKMPHEEQWINNSIGTFALKPLVKESELEIFGAAEKVDNYKLETGFSSFQPHISGGIALPNPLENHTLLLAGETQNIHDKIQNRLQHTHSKAEFIPAKTISIKVLRPEDMVFLEFEFQNFKFSGTHNISTPKAPVKYGSGLKVNNIGVKKTGIKKVGIKPATPVSNMHRNNGIQSILQAETEIFTGLELANPNQKGTVSIYFPSQHTLEEAFYETNPNLGDNTGSDPVKLPVKHLRAKKSRLVYELKAGHKGFGLSIEELLDWRKYKLQVDPRAWIKLSVIDSIKDTKQTIPVKIEKPKHKTIRSLKGDNVQYTTKVAQKTKTNLYATQQLKSVLNSSMISSIDTKKSIPFIDKRVKSIDKKYTSIEAPALLYISPNQLNDFYHKTKLELKNPHSSFISTGRKVIKPSRNLQLKPINKLSVSLDKPGEIVELWHTHLGVKMKDGHTSSALSQLKTIRALWAFDAATKADNDQGRNLPFRAALDANFRHKLVHLTSNYSIPGYTPKPVQVKRLILSNLGAYIDWKAKFRKPSKSPNLNIIAWDHLATLGRDHYVKIVEEGYLFPFGHLASLVTITERKFDKNTKSAVNKQHKYIVVLEDTRSYQRTDNQNKFIEFPFTEVRILTGSTPNIDKPEASSLINDQIHSAFIIKVSNSAFLFDLLVTDKENIEHHIQMPLAFVESGVGENNNLITTTINNYHKASNDPYTHIAFSGKEVAYAKSFAGGDTLLETKKLVFGAMRYPASQGIKFHPIMRSAEVYIDAIDKMTNTKKPVEIALVDDNNDGRIFASVANALIDFSGGSENSGGFLTPNMPINALSKLQGAVGGKLDDLKAMRFDPSSIFEALDDLPTAKIFGAIKLADLLLDLNLSSTVGEFIRTINKIRADIEELKNAILFIESDIQKKIKDSIASEKEKLEKEAKKQIEEVQEDIKTKTLELLDTLKGQAPKIPNLKTYFTETAFFAEYKFQPQFKDKSIVVIPDLLKLSVDNPQKGMSISTVLEKPFALDAAPSIKTFARFDKFAIDIVPLLKVKFNYLEFKSGSEQKTDVKVDMDADNPIEFKGALSFVNNLQSIIPNTGFSEDGPYIDLLPTGVKAGFNISIPNVEVGVCMITNISLGAYVMLPFTGAPLTMGFNFCTRENPFLLTISGFGGGGYFLMVTTLDGIQSLEAAFEFGAAMSLNVGVASGAVSVMGGFYFKMELIEVDGQEVSDVTLTGYLRMNGRLSVLGLITVSLEFYLALDAVIVDGKVEKMVGVASLKVKVEVLFFSKTVSITVRRELQGADADPKFIEMVEPDDWQQYCLAFAG